METGVVVLDGTDIPVIQGAPLTVTQAISDLDLDKTDKHVVIRTITGTTDTLVLTDDGKYLRYTNAAAVTATVPPNASVAFLTGTVITMRQAGAGQVTLSSRRRGNT